MGISSDDAERLRGRATAAEIEQLERDLRPCLLRTMTASFGVPDADAEMLLSDVFVAFLTASAMVSEPRGWLIAEACRVASAYRRRAAPPDATAEELQAVDDGLLVREAMALLPTRAREALRLRFRELWSYDEIAAELNVVTPYAKSLVRKALEKLRALRDRNQGERQP
jgi:RNA polymerase sigma factor (sigma-70 family)